jgi:hypothetical protein
MAFAVLVEAINIAASRTRQTATRGRAPMPVTTGEIAASAAAEVTGTAQPRPKSTPVTRAQSRPKSAPRKR